MVGKKKIQCRDLDRRRSLTGRMNTIKEDSGEENSRLRGKMLSQPDLALSLGRRARQRSV